MFPMTFSITPSGSLQPVYMGLNFLKTPDFSAAVRNLATIKKELRTVNDGARPCRFKLYIQASRQSDKPCKISRHDCIYFHPVWIDNLSSALCFEMSEKICNLPALRISQFLHALIVHMDMEPAAARINI